MSTNKGLYTYDDFERKAQEYGFTPDQISDADRRLAQTNADAGVALLGYKNDWLNADNDSAKAMAHAAAEDIRARYGNYTGGANGGSFTPTGTAEYEDPWETAVQAQIRSLEDRKFEWSPETDPTVKYYEDAYRREGERAMKDTLGAVAATTGGIPSSYATAAAAQQRNYYAQQLTDKYPELYQQAYENFLAEYDRDYQMLDAYSKLSDTEYGRWYDKQASDRQARQDAAAATQQAFENNMRLEELAIIKDEFELTLQKFDHEKQMAIKDDAYRWAALIQEGKIAEAEQEYRNSALALDEKEIAMKYAYQYAELGYKQDALAQESRQADLDREQKLILAQMEEQLARDRMSAEEQLARDQMSAEEAAAAQDVLRTIIGSGGDMASVAELKALGFDTSAIEAQIAEQLAAQNAVKAGDVTEGDVVNAGDVTEGDVVNAGDVTEEDVINSLAGRTGGENIMKMNETSGYDLNASVIDRLAEEAPTYKAKADAEKAAYEATPEGKHESHMTRYKELENKKGITMNEIVEKEALRKAFLIYDDIDNIRATYNRLLAKSPKTVEEARQQGLLEKDIRTYEEYFGA